jgi:hypothetical protein
VNKFAAIMMVLADFMTRSSVRLSNRSSQEHQRAAYDSAATQE